MIKERDSKGRIKKQYSFNKEKLYDLYIKQNLSLSEIGKLFGCSGTGTIHRAIKFYGIVKPKKLATEVRSRLNKGENHPCWKGGRIIEQKGYIKVYHPDHLYADAQGYVREHRLVMEKHLRKTNPNHPALIEIDGKKYLSRDYIVHHKNGIKEDNRIENLQLFENGGKHTSYEFAKKRKEKRLC